jgi:DNA-binding NtrC family response regulator
LEDIPLLANHFIQIICDEYGMPSKNITEDAITELQKINWTGNIREFRNVIERLIILCDQNITGDDVLKFAAPLK